MVGRSAASIGAEVVDAPMPGDVQVAYAQARILRGAGVAVRAVLDESDRGGPGRLAKRWHRWYADAAEIARCDRSTSAMLLRAGTSLAHQNGQ